MFNAVPVRLPGECTGCNVQSVLGFHAGVKTVVGGIVTGNFSFNPSNEGREGARSDRHRRSQRASNRCISGVSARDSSFEPL